MASALSGKTALVTGASAGIGAATARALAEAGAKVVLAARRADRLRALAKEIDPVAENAVAVACDCAAPADVDSLVQRAITFGGGKLDIVIVNAGFGLAGGLMGSDRERWESLYQLNVIGAAHLMRRAAEHMMPRKSGDIVAIGSAVGVNISPFSAFYGSSKFAVGAIAEGLRREICQSGVRVSLVKPGIVESEFQEVAGYDEKFRQGTQRFGQLLQPADIARAITFVVSQPPHVHINDLTVRPLGQDYP